MSAEGEKRTVSTFYDGTVHPYIHTHIMHMHIAATYVTQIDQLRLKNDSPILKDGKKKQW